MNSTNSSSEYICLSLWPLDMPKPHLITWAVLSAVLSPITIVSNAALIYGLYETQQLISITNQFILVMNVSDLCTGIFVLPLIVVMISTKDRFRSCVFELAMQYLAFVLAYFSFFMLMCISLDRYIHVTKLNKYNQFMNPFRMKIIVVISMVVSLVIASISISFPSLPLQVLLNLSDLAGVLLMFFLYSLVFRKIAIHAEKFKRMLEEQGTDLAIGRETRREMSATKTIRFVLGALLVLYLPYNICSAAWTYYKFGKRVSPPLALDIAAYWSYTIVFSNAAINAIILGYGNSVVRRCILEKVFHEENQVFPTSTASSTKNGALPANA